MVRANDGVEFALGGIEGDSLSDVEFGFHDICEFGGFVDAVVFGVRVFDKKLKPASTQAWKTG